MSTRDDNNDNNDNIYDNNDDIYDNDINDNNKNDDNEGEAGLRTQDGGTLCQLHTSFLSEGKSLYSNILKGSNLK